MHGQLDARQSQRFLQCRVNPLHQGVRQVTDGAQDVPLSEQRIGIGLSHGSVSRRSMHRSIEFAEFQEFLTQLEPPRFVHVEHGDRRSSRGRQSDDFSVRIGKMFRPNLCPRIEKNDRPSRFAVNAAEVRRFRQIAPNARPGQILQVVRAAVLPRDDVLDLVTPKRSMFLPQPAVFTAVVGPFLDSPARRGIH